MRPGGLILASALAASLAACGSSSTARAPGRAACAWHAQQPGPRTTDDLTGVSFPDRTHGWAVGGIDKPVIRATSDGGVRWRAQHVRGQNGLGAVSFTDDSHGWAVGVHNLLLTTTDGGSSWRAENSGITRDGNLYGVRFVDRRHGWIVGSQGLIRATADGGRTWAPQTAGTSSDLQQVTFTDTLHGWIQAGDSEVLRTTDGGRSWTSVYRASSQKNEIVAGVFFLDARRGWESGSQDDGQSNHGVVSQTVDGGRTWKHYDAINFDDVRFGAIAFVDALHGWVAGYQGELWYTDNGGVSWGSRPGSSDAHRSYQMVFRDATHGWAVGQLGSIGACTA
ncbi:MAG: YCF48-related protein [Actinomycetota bacterium]|nr:YCF48-related protein [Actinomycetota bacterium]